MYDSVNTWSKVCNKLGHDPKAIPGVSMLSKEVAKFTLNSFKAKMIADAVNKVDEENGVTNKPYYLPYFYKDPGGGFSFFYSGYGTWDSGTYSFAAALLCFRTREASDFAGKIFIEIFKLLIG